MTVTFELSYSEMLFLCSLIDEYLGRLRGHVPWSFPSGKHEIEKHAERMAEVNELKDRISEAFTRACYRSQPTGTPTEILFRKFGRVSETRTGPTATESAIGSSTEYLRTWMGDSSEYVRTKKQPPHVTFIQPFKTLER